MIPLPKYICTFDNLRWLSNEHLSEWYLSSQHLTWRHLSILAISQLLLARFWPNFKGRFLWPFLTDANCHSDICSGNICPYQEYLSSYWPWPIFLNQIFGDLNFFEPCFCDPRFFQTQKLFLDIIFFLKFFWANLFWDPNFWT